MDGSCEVTNKPKGWRALLKSWYFWKPVAGFVAGAVGCVFIASFFAAPASICCVTAAVKYPVASTVIDFEPAVDNNVFNPEGFNCMVPNDTT